MKLLLPGSISLGLLCALGSTHSPHGRRHSHLAPRIVSQQPDTTIHSTSPNPSENIVDSTRTSNSYHEFLHQQRLAHGKKESSSHDGELSGASAPVEEPTEHEANEYKGPENNWGLKIMAAGLLLGAAL